jgi:hypothetical protein
LTDPISPVSEILKRVPAKQLMSVYKVATFDGVDSFLQQVANARGKLKRGGVVDVEVREATRGKGEVGGGATEDRGDRFLQQVTNA